MAIKIYEVAMVKQRLKNVTINDNTKGKRQEKQQKKTTTTHAHTTKSDHTEMKNLLKEMVPLARRPASHSFYIPWLIPSYKKKK